MTNEAWLKSEKEHLVTDLPAHFKTLLNVLYDARFMTRRRNSMIKYDEFNSVHSMNKESGKQYLGLDWQILNCGRHENYDISRNGIERYIFRFGEIPSYQHDNLNAIEIDFTRKKMSVVTGRAFGPYGSGIRMTKRDMQRYLAHDVDRFWKEHELWMKNSKPVDENQLAEDDSLYR